MSLEMFNSIQIKNFRAIDALEINDIGRFNLLVSKNGVGKTSVLEAVALQASGFDVYLTQYIAKAHDLGRYNPNTKLMEYSMSEFAHGAAGDSRDSVLSLGTHAVIASRFPNIKGYNLFGYFARNYPEDLRRRLIPETVVIGSTTRDSESAWLVANRDGFQDLTPTLLNLHPEIAVPITLVEKSNWRSMPLQYVPTHGFVPEIIERLWNSAVDRGQEADVESLVRCVLPEVDRINLRTNGEGRGVPMVRLRDKRVLPLRALGEGAVRATQLALAMVCCAEGVCLIDEFEIGLHYSVFEGILESLCTMARVQDVQVFLTTHSSDVVQAFLSLAHRSVEDFRVFRLARLSGPEHHVCSYGGEKLLALHQLDLEVR